MRDSVIVEEDVIASTRRGIAALEEQGVDAIVVLSHLSYKGDRTLAQHVSGIDLIVSGHGGKTLNAPKLVAPGTWVVASGSLGQFLARAEVEFEESAEGEPAVAGVTGDIIGMDPALPNDPRLDPLFARYEEERKALQIRELESMQAPGAPSDTRGDDESIRLENPQS